MNKLCLLVGLTVSINCQNVLADDYEVNPDAANGYAASMAAYHYHGSYLQPSQEQNGYAASEARSRFGLNPLLVPKSSEDSESSGRWGGGSGGRFRRSDDNTGGGEGWRGRFRQGEADENQRNSAGPAVKHPLEEVAGAALTMEALRRYRMEHEQLQGTASGGLVNPYMKSTPNNNYNHNSILNQYATPGAPLRNAAAATPLRNLLRNGDGGFNRIYTDE
jgi:hypothetical protein